MNEHEKGFLAFVVKEQRHRLQTLFELGPKRRRDILERLHHAIRFEPAFAELLSGNQQFAPTLLIKLIALGAPSQCHIISADSDIDGRNMPLEEGLWAVVSNENGSFLSCVPGKLGVFNYEDMKMVYLLRRP